VSQVASPLAVFDLGILSLMRQVILELKKMNLHFGFLTSETVADDDIEDKLGGE